MAKQNGNSAGGRALGVRVHYRLGLRLGAMALAAAAQMHAALAADFSTPEAALKALETAYFHEDLEAAVAARDFDYEARASLLAEKGLKNPDPDLLKQTTLVLELSFRKQMKFEGFPDYQGRACAIVKKTALRRDRVDLVEECYAPNGDKSRATVQVAKTTRGWRVVELPPR